MLSTPEQALVTGFKEIQECAAEMSTQNAESAVNLVEKIGKAQSIQDILLFRRNSPESRWRPTLRKHKSFDG